MTTLTTARLRLEPMCDAHLDGLDAMNSDPEVMRYTTGKPQTRAETATLIQTVQKRWERFGYSWWSFVDRESGEVVGAGCIQNLRPDGKEPDPACPLEIGWRLRRDKWGLGFAFEAAVEMARFAFDQLEADLLCAVCNPKNAASIAIMEKLHMRYRGIEKWYAMDVTSYEITSADWRTALPELQARLRRDARPR